MADPVEEEFLKNFSVKVYQAYQRMGSKLRNTVRTKSQVKGSSTIFHRIGKPSVPVRCDIRDYHAGDWVDDLDPLKINHDEKMVLANAGAYALGRKTDELIINSLVLTPNLIEDEACGMTLQKVMAGFESLHDRDVPDDGQRYAIVGWKQWAEMLRIDEFSEAAYIEDDLPWKGTQAKRWLGTLWMPHSGLPVASGIRSCFWYHRTAMGHATGSKVQCDLNWHGDHAAHFINNCMSQGATLIDGDGVVCIKSKE